MKDIKLKFFKNLMLQGELWPKLQLRFYDMFLLILALYVQSFVMFVSDLM